MRFFIIAAIRLYQLTLSPLLAFLAGPGGGCRFEPSCSRYCIEAVRIHGAWRGSRMGLWRIMRCNPWGGGGYDPVPPPSNRRQPAAAGARGIHG